MLSTVVNRPILFFKFSSAADADAKYIVRSFHYDAKGNVIQMAEIRPDEAGGVSSGSITTRISTKYGFTSNVMQSRETVLRPRVGNS